MARAGGWHRWEHQGCKDNSSRLPALSGILPLRCFPTAAGAALKTTALRTLRQAFKVFHVEITGKRTGGQRCVSMPKICAQVGCQAKP